MVILVIGILIAGISQAIEMFSEASLKSARNLSKSSRITRIDDLSLWLDATSDKAFDKEKDDNSTISIWKDVNPRSTAQIVVNPVSSNLPTYTLSAINGLPTASFKKTSSNCMTISNQSFINNSEDFTLYLIYSPKTLDDGIILEKNNATATNYPFSLELNAGFYKFSVKNSSTTLSVLGAKKANINKPNLIRLSRTKGSQIEITINGVSSTQSDTLTSSTLNTTELAIGCRNGATPTSFMNGDVGEISYFNRNLSVKEKSDIEEYLYKKWKMKKNEGVLASQEFIACSVPSNINADSAVTTVQPTASAQIACATGFIGGSINYKCNSGVFTVLSGLCFKNCTIPSTANTTADNNAVSPTSNPVSLTCKTGFSGGVNYTCSNNGTLSTTGTCNALTCTYTETGSGNSQCLSTINETRIFNVGDSGIMLCPYGANNKSFSTIPQRDMKYRCNSNGTMQYDVRPRCYINTTYQSVVFNSPNPYNSSTSCVWVSGRNEGSTWKDCIFTFSSCNQTPNYWSF